MSNRRTIVNFWLGFTASTLFNLAIMLWVGITWGWGVGAVVAIILFLLTKQFLANLKQQIILGLPVGNQYQSALLTEFEGIPIDRQTLAADTQAFEALGFRQITTYKLETPQGLGVASLFVHSEYSCFADINQFLLKPNYDPQPMKSTVVSPLEQGWQLITTNRQPDSFFQMWRQPRKLWMSRTALSASELVQLHLDFRHQMMERLGIVPQGELSWDKWVELEREEAIARRETIQRRPLLLGLWRVLWFELRPKTSWFGAYKPRR